VIEAFASVFETEVRDGSRTIAPAAWAPSAAR